MSETAKELLRNLVNALDSSYISSWQSTAGWSTELTQARDYLNNLSPIQTETEATKRAEGERR